MAVAITLKEEPSPVVLPSKLSALIAIAVKDVRAVEAANKRAGRQVYKFDMDVYHQTHVPPKGKPVCNVCFAGCVIVNSLETPLEWEGSISNFGANAPKLHALDCVRVGLLEDAAVKLGVTPADRLKLTDFVHQRKIAILCEEAMDINRKINNKEKRKRFLAIMSTFARELKAIGL